MIQRGEEKAAEPTLGWVNTLDPLRAEEECEEALSQILGLMVVLSRPADEGVERIPVGRAEFCQCFLCSERIIRLRGKHDAPVCRLELGMIFFRRRDLHGRRFTHVRDDR